MIKRKNAVPETAVLYFFGINYIYPPDSGDFVLCSQIAENCNAEVWFPLYPMAPAHRLKEALAGMLEAYKDILGSYDAGQVRFFGMSSGGGLAMSLCTWIIHNSLDVPLPGGLVLQSPGVQVPPSPSQREQMEQLRKQDVVITPLIFDHIAPMLADKEDAYLLSPILNEMTGFPPTDVFYGTHEVMYAYLADLEAAYARYGLTLNVHIGEGMMHAWGAMDLFVPEARQVRQAYFKALRGE